MTGIPDAEAAWNEIQPAWFGDSKEAFLAGFAAAEGPWREHLATQIEALGTVHGPDCPACHQVIEALKIVRGTNE